MKRLVVAVLAVIMIFIMLPQKDAQANLLGFRWSHSVVCVEDHTGIHWPVGTATTRMDKVPDIHLVFKSNCSNYEQKIKVYECWCGDTHWWAKTNFWVFTAHPDRLALVKIRLNNTYRGELNWNDRRSVIMHEIGHGLGLAHTIHYKSLMNINTVFKWDYPTIYDKDEVDRRYPW
jgi:hypothetical protein